jgi:hypothetical protein
MWIKELSIISEASISKRGLMKHDELVEKVAKALEHRGYDVSIEGIKTGWKKLAEDIARYPDQSSELSRRLHEKPENLAWVDLANVASEWWLRVHPDVVAVKGRNHEVVLVECKASESEAGKFAEELADMCVMARLISQSFKKVRVVLALDIDTSEIEFWGAKDISA